jgi:hypothetical protein
MKISSTIRAAQMMITDIGQKRRKPPVEYIIPVEVL